MSTLTTANSAITIGPNGLGSITSSGNVQGSVSIYGDQTGTIDDSATGNFTLQLRQAYIDGFSQAQVIAAAASVGINSSDILKIIQN